jgi:predicted anti-sigma-YlaC factor YlaD
MVTSANSEKCIEKSEEIAAYLDGELSAAACAEVEQHLKECPSCKAGLREQQHLLSTLDFALTDDPALRLPVNFSRVVAAHAQADMSGLRQRSEHGRALRLCAALLAASFVLLLLGGVAFSETVLRPVISLGRHLASLFDLLWQVLRGAGTGIGIILRAVSRQFLFDSHPLGLFIAFLLFISVLVAFARLIASYHRELPIGEDGA